MKKIFKTTLQSSVHKCVRAKVTHLGRKNADLGQNYW